MLQISIKKGKSIKVTKKWLSKHDRGGVVIIKKNLHVSTYVMFKSVDPEEVELKNFLHHTGCYQKMST